VRTDIANIDINVVERGRGDRSDLFPILEESFGGIYLWHARWILRSRAVVLASESRETPSALAIMELLAPTVGYVYYLAVSRLERHRGLGGLLLDRCLSRLISAGARTVLASVTRGNLPSERLVVSRGFSPCIFRDLTRQFGAAKAFKLWMGMTVAPGLVAQTRLT